jgi:hypothetical protein
VEDDQDQDREVDDTGLSSDEVNPPNVPIWYRNAMTRQMWEEASPSEKEAVEQYKIDEANKMSTLVSDEMGEDDWQKVTRLEGVVLFVTSHIWP